MNNFVKQKSANQPVIILCEKTADNFTVRQWLKKSRFFIGAADDIFQAFEEISDYTVRSRPDVILLEVGSLAEDFFVIRETIQTLSDESGFPIFALSNTGKNINHEECFEGNLAQLAAELDRIIPKHARVRAA